MGCSNVPTPVFVETNLSTSLAVPVSPDITACEFKREVEGMHLNCFPEFGSVKVDALMVKQKSRYYHLSESLPLKYAFLGSNVTWFLRINVHPRTIPDHSGPLKCNDLNSIANVVTGSVEMGGFTMSAHEKRTNCKRKKVKIQRFPYLKAPVLKISALLCFSKRKRKRKNVKKKRKLGCPEQGPVCLTIEKETLCQFACRAEVNQRKRGEKNVIAEAPSDTFSEPASVSGIIEKYFTDYDEVASSFTTVQNRRREWLNSSNKRQYLNIQSPQVSQDVWLEKPSSEASKKKRSKPEVGKRLLVASDRLGLTPSNKQSVLNLCKYTDGKSPLHKSSGTVRNLVFEMTEESD